MKSVTKYLTFHVEKRFKLINITPEIEKIVQDSKISDGLCLVNSMHITSSIFINDDEGGYTSISKDGLRSFHLIYPLNSTCIMILEKITLMLILNVK